MWGAAMTTTITIRLHVESVGGETGPQTARLLLEEYLDAKELPVDWRGRTFLRIRVIDSWNERTPHGRDSTAGQGEPPKAA